MSVSKAIVLVIEGNKVGGATLKGEADWPEVLKECGEAIKNENMIYNVSFTQDEIKELTAALPLFDGKENTWAYPL